MVKPKNVIPLAKAGHINWLNYGEPGVGKSVLAGTAPSALVLANHPDETVSMRGSSADLWTTPDYDELSEAAEYVMHGGYKDYDWVILDNATLLQEQGLDDIMATLVAEKPHRDRWVPDMKEYLVNQNRFSHIIRTFVQAPINFMMTAHVMTVLDEEGEDYRLPSLQGGKGVFSQKVCGYMNLVTYMKVAKVDAKLARVIYTRSTNRFHAKDRFGPLEPRLVNVTVPQVIELLKAKPAPKRRVRKTSPKTQQK